MRNRKLGWPWNDLHAALVTVNITDGRSRLSVGYISEIAFDWWEEENNNRSKGWSAENSTDPETTRILPHWLYKLPRETKRCAGSAWCRSMNSNSHIRNLIITNTLWDDLTTEERPLVLVEDGNGKLMCRDEERVVDWLRRVEKL